jgi:hypothetical protein
MSFVYGTNAELLYSMPASGASIAVATKQIVSATTTTNPPFYMPPLQNIWPVSQMPGKALHFMAAGGYDVSANTNIMALTLDSAFSTTTYTLGATGAATWAASTTGFWQLELDLTCVAAGYNSTFNGFSVWYSGGNITLGPANAPTGFGSAITFSNTVTAGIPQPNTIPTATSYAPTLYTTWGGSPTAFVCTQYQVWALN